MTKTLCGEQLYAWDRAERYTHSVRGGWRVGGGRLLTWEGVKPLLAVMKERDVERGSA